MKKFISTLILISFAIISNAQVITPFSIRYQATQKGGIRYISNTSVTCSGSGCGAGRIEVPPAGTSTDNGFTAAYVDIDADATTFSSSSDSLDLPLCSDISWAGLYWGGENTTGGSNYATRNQCKIKVNSGAYVSLTADASQDNAVGFDTYHCFKDITSLVKAAGTKARFTVANVAARVGGTNRFGGWSIVVVYKNDLQPMRNLTVFNGLSNVSGSNPTTDISVSGFLTPLSGPVTFEIGAITYDGDRSSTGDQLLFNGAGSFVNISDAINPLNDIFNSTLSYNGVAKASPFINPVYTNTLGYDADIFIPTNTSKNYIGNSATSATIRLTTGGETFLTQVVTMAIDVYEPDLRATVSVVDLNGGTVQPGDILEYTVTGKNIGSDPSVNTFITDTLERNADYVPGSLQISYGPNLGAKTDAAGDDQAEYIAASRVIKVRAGTGANSTAGGTMLNSPSGTDYTEFKYRVTAATDCIILACDNVIDNRAYIFGTGNISGNTFNNQSSPGAFDGNGCPISGITSSTIVNSCAAPNATNSTPACVGGTVNLFASQSANASYSWSGPNSFSSTLYNPVISNATTANNGTYTVTITIAGTTCSFSPSTTVTVNSPTQTLSGTPGGGAFTQTHDVSVAVGVYTDPSCNVISKITASGASPVTGNITSKVWVETSVPTYAGKPYVARHYEITPATNVSTSTGTVTLYFLQSEFDAFNAAAGANPKLPTGPSDATGKANLRVGAYSGTSSGNTGLPGSYSASGGIIDPADANIVWNASASRWEITFSASGFGGFIVQTNLFVLPVTLVYFTGENVNGKILLKWQTSTELNSDDFIVEYSTDGRIFNSIATLPAAGNSINPLTYNFTHNQPRGGENYYRLKQVDKDGEVTYSGIVKINLPLPEEDLTILVNPVNTGTLEVAFRKLTTAFICNADGQVIKQLHVNAGRQTINVNYLPQGVYLLRSGNSTKKFIISK